MKIIIDGRGKKMVTGGRHAVARHARYLRNTGFRWAARGYIASAAQAYVAQCERDGWTYGQRVHNRLVEI